MTQIRSFLLPDLVDAKDLAATVVVIDVLRASTTICRALSEGALFLKPFLGVEETFAFAHQFKENKVVTGGERKGIKVPGFDFGNSPLEYSQQKVKNRGIAFTSTNGTKAMHQCQFSDDVVIGSFCNLSAVCRYLAEKAEFDLVCAGTDGEITLEDSVFAGAIVDVFAGQSSLKLNDQAEICRSLWKMGSKNLVKCLQKSRGGRNLIQLDKEEDIKFAAQVDSLSIVPKLDIQAWKIEPA
ncbi:MAG: 2-phosphosulfolactate phosphatase [Planctomycetota bacterium]|nr:2-phosphosulfolactate phosphatase [Planctomycetota bacterium]